MSNPSIVYSSIFVDVLAQSGLKHVCLAPGSRNTPLVLAFSRHKRVKKYSHLDERSAAFFALGLALAGDEPVALVCTSGSAVANFFPAIIEAHQSHIPLIVITADRPHELRHSGANQTIDQTKIYGDYVLWSVDVALPEDNPTPLIIRNLQTMAARVYGLANGLRKGAVHINMPFRKPLEPTLGNKYVPASSISVQVFHGEIHPNNAQIGQLGSLIEEFSKGLIICGSNTTNQGSNSYLELSRITGYPVLAECISGLRFQNETTASSVLGAYDTFLPYSNLELPDVVLQFGNVPTSKSLLTYLDQITPEHRILIAEDGVWKDAQHKLTALIQANPAITSNVLSESIKHTREAGKSAPNEAWKEQFHVLENTTWEVIDRQISNGTYFDGAVLYDVVDLISDESTLFVGNSLSVRHLDQFGKPTKKRIFAYANRGASGIDGNISTALGAGAYRPNKPLVAVVGDITFYHDMNGLLAVQRCGIPITIVLLNNNGGGIFYRLPIREFDPEFTDYFVTPHGLDFSHAAKLYGLDYICVTERNDFREAFGNGVGSAKSSIIEVKTDAHHDNQRRIEIVQAVQTRLQELKL